MTADLPAGTLQTKTGSGYTTDDGQVIPSHPLYRYVDENGNGGVWYSTLERARQSWARRTQGPDGPGRSAAGPAGPGRART